MKLWLLKLKSLQQKITKSLKSFKNILHWFFKFPGHSRNPNILVVARFLEIIICKEINTSQLVSGPAVCYCLLVKESFIHRAEPTKPNKETLGGYSGNQAKKKGLPHFLKTELLISAVWSS